MKKGRLAIRVRKVSSLEVDEEKAKRTVLELLSREPEVRLFVAMRGEINLPPSWLLDLFSLFFSCFAFFVK